MQASTSEMDRSKWLASGHGRFTPQGNKPYYLFNGRLGEPHRRAGDSREENRLDNAVVGGPSLEKASVLR